MVHWRPHDRSAMIPQTIETLNVHNDPRLVRTAFTRPLSDIRELTEPSLLESARHTSRGEDEFSTARRPATAPTIVPAHQHGNTDGHHSHNSSMEEPRLPTKPQRHSDGDEDLSSIYSIPIGRVPPRSTSRPRDRKRSRSTTRRRPEASVLPQTYYIANTTKSQSPVKGVACRLDVPFPISKRAWPEKTLIKTPNSASHDILDHPYNPHPRIKLELIAAAPLFVGGSSVEGTLRIIVDDAERTRHKRTLTLERATVDLLGVEEVSGPRRNIFLARANELVDLCHPPPIDMVDQQQPKPSSERSWILITSIANIPFLITLPLEVGPPPFRSRHARIRYVLSATLTIKDTGRELCVRHSQEISILSVYDPEKALISLPSPLTAMDEYHSSRGSIEERIIVTAGLHRQVWVSGTDIFADVHISNNSQKTITRLALQLERVVLCYRHAAAATREISAHQARIFDSSERKVVSSSTIKRGQAGWNGVTPHSSILRTCSLEVPRGQATIKCNKYFEVRFYLNVIAGTRNRKIMILQLPIILIHMNSLDVPTNSVAQVAAAIEEKRGTSSTGQTRHLASAKPHHKLSGYLQGRAFQAPREQSIERSRAYQAELRDIAHVLEASPRRELALTHKKIAVPQDGSGDTIQAFTFKTPPSNRKGRVILDDDADMIRERLRQMRSFSSTDSIITIFGVQRDHEHVQDSRRPRASSALGRYGVTDHDNAPITLGKRQTQSLRQKPSLQLPKFVISGKMGNWL